MARGYDDSEDSLLRPVEPREVQEILADSGRPFVKNAGYLQHLLTRVLSTLSAHERAHRAMQLQLERQSQQASRVGAPTTLSPLDAVRYLDDEQKEQIFDRITRDRLRMLRSLVSRAEAEQRLLDEQLALVRRVARSLSEQTDLPPHVRAEVTRALAALPSKPAAVHHPPLLDYPDPEPRVPAQPPAPTPGPALPVNPSAGTPTFVDPYVDTTAAPVFVDPYADRTAAHAPSRSLP